MCVCVGPQGITHGINSFLAATTKGVAGTKGSAISMDVAEQVRQNRNRDTSVTLGVSCL